MLRACRLIRGYTKRGILSIFFPASILIFAMVMFLSVWDEMKTGLSSSGVYYYMRFAYATTMYFLMIICTIPSALQFSKEWRSSYYLFSCSRIGRLGYSVSLIFSAALLAFLTAVAGGTLFLLISSLKVPLISDGDPGLIYCIEAYANGGLMAEGKYFLYYFLMIVAQSALCALMSAFAVLVSVFFTDPFVTSVSPMMVFIIITNLMSIAGIPQLANPYYVFSTNGYNFRLMNPNEKYNFSVASCLYPFLYLIVFLVILTFLVNISLKNRYEGREV